MSLPQLCSRGVVVGLRSSDSLDRLGKRQESLLETHSSTIELRCLPATCRAGSSWRLPHRGAVESGCGQKAGLAWLGTNLVRHQRQDSCASHTLHYLGGFSPARWSRALARCGLGAGSGVRVSTRCRRRERRDIRSSALTWQKLLPSGLGTRCGRSTKNFGTRKIVLEVDATSSAASAAWQTPAGKLPTLPAPGDGGHGSLKLQP